MLVMEEVHLIIAVTISVVVNDFFSFLLYARMFGRSQTSASALEPLAYRSDGTNSMPSQYLAVDFCLFENFKYSALVCQRNSLCHTS